MDFSANCQASQKFPRTRQLVPLFCRELISKIAKPLTDLLHKDKTVRVDTPMSVKLPGSERQVDFWPQFLLLQILTRTFVIYCNASHQGLGCVLMQERKVITYGSRQLCIRMKRTIPLHDLELAAVIYALKWWATLPPW